ncbi:MAG: MMPL family transporter [Alphaproteobacteria bacterium]
MIFPIATLVDLCRRYAWAVALLFVLLTGFCGWYATAHFRMNTDVNTLLSENLEWRQQEKEIEKSFPARNDLLVVVIDGQDAAQTEIAAATLAARMSERKDLFKTVRRPDVLPFFRQNGLLYLDQAKLADTIDSLMRAQPMLGALAADQSLRGLFRALNMMLMGFKQGAAKPEQFVPVLEKIAASAASVKNGQPVKLDWQSFLSGGAAPDPHGLRRFIMAQPVLDYAALSPGAAATSAVRMMAKESGFDRQPGLQVRLTGSVALNDEEFSSIADGMGIAALGSLILVGTLLILALKSLRIVVPILLTLGAGLVATTAFGIAAIGSLNLISVAFAVMFIGIAVDFGIQFGVRFRDQHFHHPELSEALSATARVIALPLALAAASTAAGFLAFTPTDYAGVAELGLIAGAGMIIALLCNITLLPALIAIFKPPAEQESVGFRWAAPLNGFLQRHRIAVIVAASGIAVACIGVTTQLRFDFDPLNLKDPKTESVATLFDLAKNLESTPYTAQILAPEQAQAEEIAARLRALPEVARVMTANSFVPEDQEPKLQMLRDTQMILTATLTPIDFAPPPRADDLVQATAQFAGMLGSVREQLPVAGELADILQPMQNDANQLFALQDALLSGLSPQLVMIRDLLAAQAVTSANLPPELLEDWVAPDGKTRIEIYPKDNPRDPENLLRFNHAIKTVFPGAGGTTISIAESGNTVVHAFVSAALTAMAVIAGLLLVSLRRIFDALAVLMPLVLAALLTLATSVLAHIPINFANIIGLPLLLGLGVSFAIYFVTYWRAGGDDFLQSSMARAVVFSASTTLVAFGSLALSAHKGTASMGIILTIALLYALFCTCFLLPALLRRVKPNIV